MATGPHTAVERRMSAGRVFERAFGTLLHNPLVTLGLAFLLGGLPGLLTGYFFSSMTAEATQTMAQGAFDSSTMGMFWGIWLLSMIVGLVISALVLAVITRATIAESEGRRASIGECLSAAVPVVLPLIGLSLLLAIGVGIGMILLLVPGIILYMMWCVAAPVLIEERLGVFDSFGRSRALTSGARWKIFGIMLLLIAIYYLLILAFGAAGFSTFEATPGTTPQLSAGFIIGSVVIGTLANALWSTVQASLYIELRNWKDGPQTENLEEVFA